MARGTMALVSGTVVLAMMVSFMSHLVAGLSLHGLSVSPVHVRRGGAWVRVERLGVHALFAMGAQRVLVVGLAGHLVDGVWLVGTAGWSCAGR